MRITLKLFATLARYLPAGAGRNVTEMDIPDDASIGRVLDDLGVPREEVHLALVDGVYVAPEELDSTPLKPGQALAVWPPVAGG